MHSSFFCRNKAYCLIQIFVALVHQSSLCFLLTLVMSFSCLRCNRHIILLNFFLFRCLAQSQGFLYEDTFYSHLILFCLAADSLGRHLLATLSQFTISLLNCEEFPCTWNSMAFYHALIQRKGSDNTHKFIDLSTKFK